MANKHLLRRVFRYLGWFAIILLGMLSGPIGVLSLGNLDMTTHWRDASLASTGTAPRPEEFNEPLIQVYGARAYHWRGAFAIHTWIATKRTAADHYSVYQVIGWNLYRGHSAVSVRRQGPPDFLWFNARPDLLLERRGDGVEALIDRIEEAVQNYPYGHEYRVWPGPNSNTFTAYVAREVPELGLDLPPTAIGKDYLPGNRIIDRMPSGTGWQFSLYGLLGLGVARSEGLEFNLLGLSAGIDVDDLALRLPGIGRVDLVPPG
ncbi:MAG: DUF3750 domain-containing protein [Gammaproteobacteria bacterium]|nr:DUF3750 domain-containing protein [Gammaproteobacteria bacterium]